MTYPYELNPRPNKIAVICPHCGKEAEFEFAVSNLIRRREHVDWFKAHDAFTYVKAQSGGGGGYQHHAVFYPGLMPGRLSAIDDWPDGYGPEMWTPREPWVYYARARAGSVVCRACGHQSKTTLDWPNDAWFQILYRNQILWAFNRDMAVELLSYIADTNRTREGRKYRSFLMKVPSQFLTAKARDTVVKRWTARLAA